MNRTWLIAPALAVSLSACANSAQLRDASTSLAGYAATRQAATQSAVERYDELNRDLARIDEGRRRRAELLAGETAIQVRAWTLVEDKTRLRYVAEATRVTPESLAALPASVAAIPPLDPGVFKTDFGKAVAAAAKLGKTPNLKARAKSAIEITWTVNDFVEGRRDGAAAATDIGSQALQSNSKAVDQAAGLK